MPPGDPRLSRAVAIIPARLGSTRLPRKVLADVGGRPLVRWVWERARQAPGIDAAIIATDSDEVYECCRRFTTDVVMTDLNHPSGTDRAAEVVRGLDADWVLNVQGDEPLIDPALLGRLVQALREGATMATARAPLRDPAAWRDPNVVKVVCDDSGHALYFSRAPIPWPREGEAPSGAWRHLGVYGYQREALLRFAAAPPAPLERIERLEQLRALHLGWRVRLVEAEDPGIGIDTPEDLERFRRLVEGA